MIKKILLLLSFLLYANSASAFQVDVQRVCFSPDDRCTSAIVEQIGNAKSEILVQTYSFTSAPIAKALISANKRGVTVEAILDKSNVTANYSAAKFISNHGILVFIDSQHPIAHNKIIIVDKKIVITGSFNFTKAAEKNAENTLIINSRELADNYLGNWERHRRHSTAYHGKN